MKQSNTVARRWLTPLSAALLSLYAASGYAANCEYIVDNEWNNGFVAKIKITNDSNSAINDWDITWSYSGDNTVSNSWNATLSGTNPYTASALSWNSSIAAGQSVEFGMQGSKGSGAAEIPTLSGSVCSSNPQPTSTPQPTPTVAPTPTATPTITPTPTPTATPIPGNALHMEPPIATRIQLASAIGG